jgi:hypothetical protein
MISIMMEEEYDDEDNYRKQLHNDYQRAKEIDSRNYNIPIQSNRYNDNLPAISNYDRFPVRVNPDNSSNNGKSIFSKISKIAKAIDDMM